MPAPVTTCILVAAAIIGWHSIVLALLFCLVAAVTELALPFFRA